MPIGAAVSTKLRTSIRTVFQKVANWGHYLINSSENWACTWLRITSACRRMRTSLRGELLFDVIGRWRRKTAAQVQLIFGKNRSLLIFAVLVTWRQQRSPIIRPRLIGYLNKKLTNRLTRGQIWVSESGLRWTKNAVAPCMRSWNNDESLSVQRHRRRPNNEPKSLTEKTQRCIIYAVRYDICSLWTLLPVPTRLCPPVLLLDYSFVHTSRECFL